MAAEPLFEAHHTLDPHIIRSSAPPGLLPSGGLKLIYPLLLMQLWDNGGGWLEGQALLITLACCIAALVALRWLGNLSTGGKARAGCVPLRIDPGGRLKLLLIRSRKHPEWFTFPGGGVERGESLIQAAVRETREEAGVTGRAGKRIAEFRDERSRTVMFSMHVLAELSDWDESARERRWFDLGVPGRPSSEAAIDAVRAALSPKPVHQQVLNQVVRSGPALAKEAEEAELDSRDCGRRSDAATARASRVR